MKIVFTKYDENADEFVTLFELTHQNGMLTPSNKRGNRLLQNLIEQKSPLSDKVGGSLLKGGKYEELFHHLVKRYTSPYFGAHIEE